ncbi:MAG: hypothetical protein J1G04_06635 [Clostridiales bacterium]|nr:hypothetical protein [Clostridiales bacterium]
MIKTDNGIFYMTAGEACYIARSVSGRLKSVWFGARIEPEDDIFGDGFMPDELELVVDGEVAELAVSSFDVVDKREFYDFSSIPSIRGGDTLNVRMRGVNSAVEVDLYYTPYSRGGIARRVVVRNVGSKDISVKAKLCVPSVGEIGREKNYVEISGDGTLCAAAVYGGKYELDYADSVLKCAVEEDIVIQQDGVFVSPEVLFVHTDGDGNKAARIYHDIVREYIIDEKFSDERRPVALLCAGLKNSSAVATAKQIGTDALVVQCKSGVKTDELSALMTECRDDGLKFGVAFDITNQNIDKALSDIKRAIAVGADIISVRPFDGESGYRYWEKVYAFLREVFQAAEQPLLVGNADLGCLCFCALCHGDVKVIPPCARSMVVTGARGSLKTEFDLASIGCLSYALDIGALNDGIKRAVRAQIFSYQDDADLVMSGDIYIRHDGIGSVTAVVSKDKSSAYAVFTRGIGRGRAKLYGLDTHNLYRVREIGKTLSGAAIRNVGVELPDDLSEGETLSLHLIQVADYD